MGFSGAVVVPTPLGVVVDVERLLQMHGHLGAGLHVDRREGLAVELVDPIGHVAHAAREDAAHRFIAADADGAQRAVVVGDHGHAAVVGLDERGRAGAGRGDERLAAQVLLGVAAPLAADAGNAIGVADPAQPALTPAPL
ncbi:hypothetical protein [Rhodanobacter lindaniclasticus]